MLERASPLAGCEPVKADGLMIREDREFCLTQIAGDAAALRAAIGLDLSSTSAQPSKLGTAILTAPGQAWIISAGPIAVAGVAVTNLSSSRCRIALQGARARDVLAKCAPIDFHPREFSKDRLAMTGIHHVPVLIHCIGADEFHIYAMRSFALSLWQVLADAAQGLVAEMKL